MHRIAALVVVCLFTALVAGCSGKSDSAAAPPDGPKAIPADSPLAKVKVGMTMQQVSEILGMPTNQVKYATGKAWIPYYFGDDTSRLEWSYKGIGRVIFTGGNVFGGGGGAVQRVDYDPSETGVRPTE
jgi:hypothetical protein